MILAWIHLYYDGYKEMAFPAPSSLHIYQSELLVILLARARLLWTELCPQTKYSYTEALIWDVTVFGDGVYKEVIKVITGPCRDRFSVFIRRYTRERSLRSTQRRGHVSTHQKMPEKPPMPAPWSWTSPASRTVRNKFVLFKPPSLWYFVMVPDLPHLLTYLFLSLL